MTIYTLSCIVTISMFFLLFKMQKAQFSFNFRVMAGLSLGVLLGIITQYFSNNLNIYHPVTNIFKLAGIGYIKLLKMIVMPLILISLVDALLHIGKGNDKALFKEVSLALIILLLMNIIASGIALTVGTFFNLGHGLQLPDTPIAINPAASSAPKDFITTLLSFIPSNLVVSMYSENTISIVIFALFIGLAALQLHKLEPKKAQVFDDLIRAVFAIIKRIISMVINLTPYGVLGLLGNLAATQKLTALQSLSSFMIALYLAIVILLSFHLFLIFIVTKASPLKYLKNAYRPLMVAFTTRSSLGTIPVAEEALKNNFKVRQELATAIPSFGATMGMNACAGIYPALLVIMALVVTNQPITFEVITMTLLLNLIASFGVSGMPGAAYIAASITLSALNLPFGVIAIVLAIDPIIDMGRTMANVNGSMTAAILTNHFFRKKRKTE